MNDAEKMIPKLANRGESIRETVGQLPFWTADALKMWGFENDDKMQLGITRPRKGQIIRR